MGNEPGKLPEGKLEPSLAIRLALWFGIYLFGFGMFVLMTVVYDQRNLGDPDVSQDIGPQRLLVMLLVFPFGLLSFFRISLDGFELFLSCATYLLHLFFTFRVKTGRAFVLLMLILIALITCNVIGCSQMTFQNMAPR